MTGSGWRRRGIVVVFQLEGVESATSLSLVQRGRRRRILPRMRAVAGEVTGSATIIADDFTSWSLRVAPSGAWLYGGEVSGMLAWSVLSPWASLPVRRSVAIITRFFLQFQGERHYVMDFRGRHGLLLGLNKLTYVRFQAVHEGVYLVRLR